MFFAQVSAPIFPTGFETTWCPFTQYHSQNPMSKVTLDIISLNLRVKVLIVNMVVQTDKAANF